MPIARPLRVEQAANGFWDVRDATNALIVQENWKDVAEEVCRSLNALPAIVEAAGPIAGLAALNEGLRDFDRPEHGPSVGGLRRLAAAVEAAKP